MPHYQISPYLQERYVLAGQSDVYSSCNELIKRFLNIEVNAMQVHRVTNTYGSLSGELAQEARSGSLEVSPHSVVYAQLDGCMVLTREQSWQEVKVGRIFRDQDITQLSEKRKEVLSSLYTAHLGGHKEFCQDFEVQLAPFKQQAAQLVFITDGAVWIKKWIKENYPAATCILDYYHVMEYVSKWGELTYSDHAIRQQKLTLHKKILLEQGGQALVHSLEQDKKDQPKPTATKEKMQSQILNYLINNTFRMNYPEYIQRNLCIGSGAIEAAHRTLVQKRMKLSGQRWAQNNVQNMLNIRTLRLSGQWDCILNLIRNQNIKAAA